MEEKKDMLREMWRMQKLLNQRIGVPTENLTEEQQIQWLLNYCRAMSQEIAELTDSVPWKWWARYQTFDRQNAKVEIIDLFHFLISDVVKACIYRKTNLLITGTIDVT